MLEIKDLGLIASRILIALLIHGEAFNDKPIEDQMHMVGTDRRESFSRARAELERAGFITVERPPGLRPTLHVLHFQSAGVGLGGGGGAVVGANKLVSILIGEGANEPLERIDEVPPTESVVGFSTNGLSQKVWDLTESVGGDTTESVRSHSKCGTTESVRGPEVLSLLDRCREADDMDDSGDLAQRSSPAQQRRKAQVLLIQEAYNQYFPQVHQLTDKSAKAWLNWNENSAVQVVQEIEAIKSRKPNLESPLSYINAVFKGEAARSAAPTPAPVFQSAPARPTRGAAAYVPGGPLPEPTEETLKDIEVGAAFFEKLKKERGWLE